MGRRTGVVLFLAVLAGGLLLVAVPQPAEAQDPAPPRIILTPSCTRSADTGGAELISVRIAGHNFPALEPIEVFFRWTETERSPDAVVTTDAYGTFEVSLDVTRPTERDTSVLARSATGTAEAEANYRTPCLPSLVVTPDCAPDVVAAPGAPLVVRASGGDFSPSLPITVQLLGPDNTILAEASATADSSGAFRTTLTIARPPLPAGSYQAVARQSGLAGVARFQVPCPPAPSVFLAPDCGPPGVPPDRLDAAVSGFGFVPTDGLDFIEVTFDAEGRRESFLVGDIADESGNWGPVTIHPLMRPEGVYLVTARHFAVFVSPDSVAALLPLVTTVVLAETTTEFRIPCPPEREPFVALDPPGCGPAEPDVDAYEIRLRGFNFEAGSVDIVFDADGLAAPEHPPETFSVRAGADGSFVADITPSARPDGAYPLVARQVTRSGTKEASAVFLVPCEPRIDPVIRIIPESGPPGFAVIVEGEGFPPGGAVALVWSQGIGAGREMTLSASDSGAFRVSILVYHHDFLGMRTLQAGVPGRPDAYSTATDDYLVVPGRGSPPVFSAPTGPSDFGQPIVIRR